MRDFNFPEINWEDLVSTGSSDSLATQLLDATLDVCLTQHTTLPTRCCPGQWCSILDLVFTLDPSVVDDVSHLSPLGSSDHEVLM